MPLDRRGPIGVAFFLAGVGLSVGQVAEAKPFESYLKPAAVVCSPLSSASWGVAGVLPRDLCNGIESAKGAAVPPEFYYWDGEIIKARDGKYHMFMSTWSGSLGEALAITGTWRNGYVELSFAGEWPKGSRQGSPGPVQAFLFGWVDGDAAKGRMRVEGRSDGTWVAKAARAAS